MEVVEERTQGMTGQLPASPNCVQVSWDIRSKQPTKASQDFKESTR